MKIKFIVIIIYIMVNLEDGEDFFDYIVSYVYKNFLLGGGINIVLCVIFINLDQFGCFKLCMS